MHPRKDRTSWINAFKTPPRTPSPAIATLGETGLQVAAMHQGMMVVNAVAGIADVSTGTPVTPDTLFPVFSTSKVVTATIVHRLVELGVLAYDEPLARSWPAFAAHGKGGITVRHALSHRTGLQTFKNLDRSDAPSLNATGRNHEEATPDYAPGASMGYHGMTFGILSGKVIEGATGQPFAQVLHDEVTGPLGIPDLYCGVPDVPAVTNRFVALLPGGIPDSATGLVQMTDAERAPIAVTAAERGTREFQTGCMPAGGMTTNAGSIVRMCGAMREPGLDGVRMLTPATIANATVPYFDADGRHIEWVGRMGLG